MSLRHYIIIFDSFILQACAPRYVFHTENPRKAERVEPIGTCFMAKNEMTEFIEYSPCRTSKFFIFSTIILLFLKEGNTKIEFL